MITRHLLGASALTIVFGFGVAGCAQQAPAQATAQAPKPAMPAAMPMPTTKGSLTVLSPKNGATVTTTDIPAKVAVSNFRLSHANVGRPDVDGEGHIHVMLDGMNMGVLFNFYTSPDFTLEGRGITPGPHTLIFDLASNTHEDFGNTVQKVNINYQPRKAEGLPPASASAGTPAVKIASPADGTTVRPKFTLKVQPANFKPAYDLEGKPNLTGYGHYHVFVDMKMEPMKPGEMMSMAGMVGMPGSNTIPLDLTAWPDGKHTITVEAVQNDHTEIPGAKPAMMTVNLKH